MDDGYATYHAESDRADFAEQKLKIAKAALMKIANRDADAKTVAREAVSKINAHVLGKVYS
jgi:hypothetical protein